MQHDPTDTAVVLGSAGIRVTNRNEENLVRRLRFYDPMLAVYACPHVVQCSDVDVAVVMPRLWVGWMY